MVVNKKKLSVSIDQRNFVKIEDITKRFPQETTSSVINTALDMSLEDVEGLLDNPLELEEELLKRKLEDIQKMKKKKEENKNED